MIERYRTPDFYLGKCAGDRDIGDNEGDTEGGTQGDNDALMNSSTHDQTFASSGGGGDDDNVPDTATVNGRDRPFQRHDVDNSSDNPVSPSRSIIVPKEAPEVIVANGNINDNSSLEPVSVNQMINEPDENLKSEYFEAAIRAFKAYSDLAEMRLEMMRQRHGRSADN